MTTSATAKTYAVVLHTSHNGYVVRTVLDGWLAAPYTAAPRIAEFQREAVAERYCARLNGYA